MTAPAQRRKPCPRDCQCSCHELPPPFEHSNPLCPRVLLQRCTSQHLETVDDVRRCTRYDTPAAHEDGYHQWMRRGHEVRWPITSPDKNGRPL